MPSKSLSDFGQRVRAQRRGAVSSKSEYRNPKQIQRSKSKTNTVGVAVSSGEENDLSGKLNPPRKEWGMIAFGIFHRVEKEDASGMGRSFRPQAATVSVPKPQHHLRPDGLGNEDI